MCEPPLIHEALQSPASCRETRSIPACLKQKNDCFRSSGGQQLANPRQIVAHHFPLLYAGTTNDRLKKRRNDPAVRCRGGRSISAFPGSFCLAVASRVSCHTRSNTMNAPADLSAVNAAEPSFTGFNVVALMVRCELPNRAARAVSLAWSIHTTAQPHIRCVAVE